jgi:hypothetical protein
VQVGTRLHDDERVLELARAGGVQAEVALEREVEAHAGGHVDERASAPYRTVQRRELVVGGRDEVHEALTDEVLIGAVQRLLDARVDHALLGHLVAHVVVDELGVVLGAHAGQARPLGLGDAQALERVLDVRGYARPSRRPA